MKYLGAPARALHSNAVVHKALGGVKVQNPHQTPSFKGQQFVPIVFTTDKLTTSRQKLEEGGGEEEVEGGTAHLRPGHRH